MQEQKYKTSVRSNILIVEAKNFSITVEKVNTIRKGFEESTRKSFPIVLYKNIMGYYAGYDFEKNCSIYCGSRSENQSMEQIKEYLNGRETLGNTTL